jgi:hypothetical protein
MGVRVNFKFKGDLKNLQKFINNFAERYEARVGVFGDKSKRLNDDLSNADILLIHEQGVVSKNIPKRSVFNGLNLQSDQLNSDIKKILKAALIKNESLSKVYFKIALVMLIICKEAFDTEGYGTWPPNTPKTIQNKLSKVNSKKRNEAQIITLVDTGALERSFSFKIQKMPRNEIIGNIKLNINQFKINSMKL